jgi:hypothetical protein
MGKLVELCGSLERNGRQKEKAAMQQVATL